MYEKISPCPFCGSAATLAANFLHKRRNWIVYVKCENCGAQGKISYSDENPPCVDWDNTPCRDAITAWNRRINEEVNTIEQ